jgi:hypothetical protein
MKLLGTVLSPVGLAKVEQIREADDGLWMRSSRA